MFMPALIVALTAVSLQPPTVQSLLVVSTPIVVPGPAGTSRVEFRLTNRAAQAVTAWKVTLTLHLADGRTDESALMTDAYLAYAGLGDSRDQAAIVPAHGSTQWTTGISTPPSIGVVSIEARATAAVFADRTSVGETSDTQRVFQLRNRDCQAMESVSLALREAMLKAKGRDALRLALANLSKADTADSDHFEKRGMRRNLELALAGHPSVGVSPDDFLREWALIFEARWQAANEHRQPNPRTPDKDQ
jgi:hypothetical protein